MEFLDSIDFETKKKPNRVRSWYLYEQFKSLENSQLEATKKLKNRYCQERILRRELSERKVRRSLYDQSETSLSEISKTASVKSSRTKTSFVESNEDFLGSCYQLEDENDDDDQGEGELSQDDSLMEHQSTDYKSVVDLDDSVTSVIENFKDTHNVTDEIKEELEFVKQDIAENITLQLEAAKENIQCLEKYSDFCEVCKIAEKESEHSTFEDDIKSIIIPKVTRSESLYDNNLIAAWMKLVNFAYQVIKLNHGGNCYSDYSSQFLTAVLACDVLRRGINRMCDILQPYICPIKFYDDEVRSTSTSSHKKVKRKCNIQKKYVEPCSLGFINHVDKKPTCKFKCNKRDYNSEKNSNDYIQKIHFHKRISSEPVPSVAIQSAKPSTGEHSNTRSTYWPSELRSDTSQCTCPCCQKFKKNPMLKITEYLDGVLANMNRS